MRYACRVADEIAQRIPLQSGIEHRARTRGFEDVLSELAAPALTPRR